MKISVAILSKMHYLRESSTIMTSGDDFYRFPPGLEKWEGIFQSGKSQGILNRLEKSGENHTKYWKTPGIS